MVEKHVRVDSNKQLEQLNRSRTMKTAKHKRQEAKNTAEPETMSRYANITNIFLFLILASIFYITVSFTPMSKEEQMKTYDKMKEEVEPFRKNLSECARQVKASMVDVENFLKRLPQTTMQGKCFVACILKRNNLIKNNKIMDEYLLETNRAVYGDDHEVILRLKLAIDECMKAVTGIFEICEYASVFNDCMHIKTEHILDKLTMERRMEALGQMTSDPDAWGEEEDEMLQLVRDEL